MTYLDRQQYVWSKRREQAFQRDYGGAKRDIWNLPRERPEPPKVDKPNLWAVPAFLLALLSLIFAA